MAVDMLRLSRCLPVLAGMLVALPLMAGEEKYQVTLETNVAAKMRDGVVLRADIFRPKAEGKFPVLLVRNPYNKNTSNIASGIKAAERGYVFIHQDCRGRYASEGEWYPFRNESRDTFDTVEWAATLPYSNGKVGLIRGSYGGVSQLLGAIAQPPHLAGILPEMTAANYHDGWVYQGGAFEQWFNETWTTGSLALDTLDREVRNGNAPARWAVQLPLSNYPLLNLGSITNVAPYFTDWLEHPSDDEYWNQISIEPHYDKILVPGYHVAGWYDIFQGGPIRNYLGIKNHGGSKSAQSSQHLLIGPWAHGGMGDLDFGASGRLDLDELAFRWYDYLLKGLDTGIEHEKPVKIFVMGKNLWREEDDWPLPRAHATNFYLHSAGNANSLRGDGTLGVSAADHESSDSYLYDPANPVPTHGGGLCCGKEFSSGGFDQRSVEARDDVLVYSTPPFQNDFEVTGPIVLELYADSSAVDTDFTAKLVDVAPNGYALNLTDGILRARYRDSQARPQFMEPGTVYRFIVNLGATSNVFLPGHRLRLEVASSNFPRFDRNLNTGEEIAPATRMAKAKNTVYHDIAHPSAVILPVVSK